MSSEFALWVWIKSYQQNRKDGGWQNRCPAGSRGRHEILFGLQRTSKKPDAVSHKKNPIITKKCSIIPLSHLIKIWWTAATMRLTLIWQQDNHGRQMASNSITGVGHVMSDSRLTLTGCTRCWQTHIDPGHRECWCIIVQIRMRLVPFTFDQQFRRGGPTNSGKKTPV